MIDAKGGQLIVFSATSILCVQESHLQLRQNMRMRTRSNESGGAKLTTKRLHLTTNVPMLVATIEEGTHSTQRWNILYHLEHWTVCAHNTHPSFFPIIFYFFFALLQKCTSVIWFSHISAGILNGPKCAHKWLLTVNRRKVLTIRAPNTIQRIIL